jgi:hypothetical protein
MTKHGIRFQPPNVTFGPEVRWVLLRAFGPVEQEFPGTMDPATARSLAGTLGLCPRIGSRAGEERLTSELEVEGAREFTIASAASEAQALRLVQVAHEVAGVAADGGIPVVLLKFAALRLSGAVSAGSRSAADLDVMVSPGRVGALSGALQSGGFTALAVPDSDQHLAPLVHGSGVVVEVHRYVQGVCLGAPRRFATVDELVSGGLVVAASELPGECMIPSKEVLTAHAIVHGVAHHGRKPLEYPLFRMVADVIDLGFASADGETVLEEITPWLEREVSPEETRALRTLCMGLSVADEKLFAPASQSRPEVALLHHLVAGATDRAYAQSLQVSAFFGRVSHLPHPIAVGRALWHALFLNRAQVEKIYGPQSSRMAYLRRQMLRPLDLLFQATRSVAGRFVTPSHKKA